jgi:hypothetical protein
VNTLKKLIALLALTMLAQALPGEEPHSHDPHLSLSGPPVAQNQYYVATCSRNDLYLRFVRLGDARKAAADHAKATGHQTGVIKE